MEFKVFVNGEHVCTETSLGAAVKFGKNHCRRNRDSKPFVEIFPVPTQA